MLRAFIALNISEEARDALARVTERLQQREVSGVRWARPESIHLTLKFLGDVDTSKVDQLLGAMERAARGTAPFTLGLSGLGAFPSQSSPRVIWIGLKGEIDVLRRLQLAVDEEMFSSEGFPKEDRRFSPHLTLGRIREKVSPEDRRRTRVAMAGICQDTEVWWEAKEVHLVRSTLTPSGAMYDVLGSRRLSGAG